MGKIESFSDFIKREKTDMELDTPEKFQAWLEGLENAR